MPRLFPRLPVTLQLWVGGVSAVGLQVSGQRCSLPHHRPSTVVGAGPPPSQGTLTSPNPSKGLGETLSADSGLPRVMCKGCCHSSWVPALWPLGGGSAGQPLPAAPVPTQPCSRGLCGPQQPAISDRDGATLPLPAPWPLSAVTSHHSCGGARGSPSSEHAGNGMWFAWGQPPITMGVRKLPKQLCQVRTCGHRDAHCCERGSAPVWDGGRQQVLCAGGLGTGCAHTYVYHPLTPLHCLTHPSSLCILRSLSHMPWEWLRPPTLASDV